MNPEMKAIEAATEVYAEVDTELRTLVSKINEQIEAIYAEHTPDVHRVCRKWQGRKNALEDLIRQNPALFEKPRSQIFYGIKVGYRKGTGGMGWDDEADVVALIRKHFPDQEDVLIHTEEHPIKKALAELPASDLKKLGVVIEDTGDVVLIKPVESSVEKAIKALLKKTGENPAIKEAA